MVNYESRVAYFLLDFTYFNVAAFSLMKIFRISVKIILETLVKLNGPQIHFGTNSSKFAVIKIGSSTVYSLDMYTHKIRF